MDYATRAQHTSKRVEVGYRDGWEWWICETIFVATCLFQALSITHSVSNLDFLSLASESFLAEPIVWVVRHRSVRKLVFLNMCERKRWPLES